jgi:hypothetical protein
MGRSLYLYGLRPCESHLKAHCLVSVSSMAYTSQRLVVSGLYTTIATASMAYVPLAPQSSQA